VVVDNGSPDGSAERLARELPACRHVALATNVGFAQGCNAGAAALAGDAYVFVNNDAFVHGAGAVSRLLGAFGDPRVGIAVPRLLNADLSVQSSVIPLTSARVALARASGLSRLVPDHLQPRWSTHWRHGNSREIECAVGAVVAVRGEAWAALGGFDTGSFMYAEDIDLCWRARKLGWRIWFQHDAEFVHLGNASGSQAWTDAGRAERIGRAEAEVIRRHSSTATGWLALRFVRGGLAARWLVFRLIGNRAASATLAGYFRGYGAR
jgi:GT2 family glycosyltransferase